MLASVTKAAAEVEMARPVLHPPKYRFFSGVAVSGFWLLALDAMLGGR